MNKVITVNLNGNAYQIDEDGYNALRQYVDRAEKQLGDNADRREVIGDLEQAIADKCANCLRPHKTVVTAAEIAQILNEIGPVQNADESPRSEPYSAPRSGSQEYRHNRRLYRIKRGTGWAGICRGLAAYLDIDVIFVRVVFVFFALFSGIGLVTYIIMIFIVPVAYSEEELNMAHAMPPEMRRT